MIFVFFGMSVLFLVDDMEAVFWNVTRRDKAHLVSDDAETSRKRWAMRHMGVEATGSVYC